MTDIGINVSRETMDRLALYSDLLKKWNPKINLVARSTIDQMWQRHFVDSAQLFNLKPESCDHWVDLGSGGGFPGLVIAILRAELQPEMQVTLIESDERKSAFLRTVLREAGVKGKVITNRVEKEPAVGADVISARALADLSTLLGFASQHLKPSGSCLFPKGVRWEKELESARESWRFECESFKSETEAAAVVLKIGNIAHV